MREVAESHLYRPHLAAQDRLAHMYVIGKTGTGKSSLLEFLVRQDLANGHGIALFDLHGDLAERVYAWAVTGRRTNVIYLDVPDPAQRFGFNPLRKSRMTVGVPREPCQGKDR